MSFILDLDIAADGLVGWQKVNVDYILPHQKKKIGSGIFIHHGHSTQINAKTIGHNCQIWHNVTIGVGTPHDNNTRPTIGDNVRICAGAIVIGDIEVGNNVTIGAGSVVTKSIPDNCIIVGNPARIIKRIHLD